MGDDSLILREDGYIRMNFPVTSLTYHSNLNIILVKTDVGGVHVLDVNSGVILQSSCLSADDGGTLGVEYAAGADRVFIWDSSGVGARTDYNGVLLLHTALQRPLPSSQPDKSIRIELVLSEAVLLYQCLQSLDAHSIEGLSDFVNELKNSIDAEPVRKGVKAQKWSTVTICLPQSTLRLVTTGVVQELKGQNRRIPALAIASAVGQRANELVPCSRDEETRPLMYSEAERKETFKRWPHMDYKWALPARMAQAGFYHQPSPSGDDRAMCFTCLVCLVCWEKSDEPWVEHERHSPNCPFVRGEYTHNVPISVTNATACAVPSPNVTVVSKGNTGDLIATGTPEGKVNIWRFDCGLKLVKFIHLSPYDSIFSGILATDSNKVWSASLEKDTSTYGVELTAMAFVGMTSQQEVYPQTQTIENTEKETSTSKTKPSLICAVIITRTNNPNTDQPIKEDSSKALFDSGADTESVQAMNDQNEAKNNQTTNKMLFLLTYDIHSSLAGSITTVVHTSNSSGNSKPGGSKKVCTLARTDDANIYDEIYFQYSDEDTELPQCTNSLLDEQISNVINLNASSSKEDCKMWEPKKIILTKHFKVMPPPPPTDLLPELQKAEQASMLDFVGKISQLKSWTKNANLESVGTKLADQTDAVLQQDPITHYLNMNGPLEISDLKWYEGGDGTEKVKVTTFAGSKIGTQTAVTNSNNDGFDSDPPQEEAVSQGIAIQCLSLPAKLNLKDDSKVTHLLPTEDKEHLLVVISSIEPEKVKVEEEADNDGDTKMEVDDVTEPSDKTESDAKAYFILYKINNKTSIYTLDDNPISVKELPFNESPVDLCLLPVDKHDQYSFAAVGVDGSLRLYCLPDFKTLSEKRVPKGQFTSVVFCASVERLSVSTKHGMIYFYALNNGEKDSAGDIDEDEFANIDFEMLQRAPRDEVCGPTQAPVIIANKTELALSDLETLITLTGYYGTNTTVPYSAVVPGFWCELSPAQRSRSDHQNNRTWRLQNTSSTWDEHVLELTLPYSVSLAHIEFGFTLHSACSANLPIILVTLLKQNLHGIGYKKDASFGHRSDSPIHFPVIDADMSNLENPVNNEEYLQAHNAEILAGPLLLSSGLDLTQQSGTLILTSPRLYRARGRTFLIHIKTLFDPAKDMCKGPNKTSETSSNNSSSKKTGFIGCDWLHQISLTVRSSPHTDVPMERQQRIAMLESNSFLNTLCEIAINGDNSEKRNLAMDLIIWVVSIRLQRMRLAKTEKGKDKTVETQQLECIKIVEKYTDALIKNCILCANRSIAKKCVKILLITSDNQQMYRWIARLYSASDRQSQLQSRHDLWVQDPLSYSCVSLIHQSVGVQAYRGEKQVPKPWKCTFEQTLSSCVIACIPLVGACASAGALRWLAALAQHAVARDNAPQLVAACLALLEQTSKCLLDRPNVYHSLLKARFGLYGLPLERSIFSVDVPELGRGSSTPVTYASVLAGDTSTPPTVKTDYQLKDLLNLPHDIDQSTKRVPIVNPDYYQLKDLLNIPIDIDSKSTTTSTAWWAQNNGVGVFSAGLSEAMPLHVTCHIASDGTKLESSGARYHSAVVSSLPGGGPGDPTQLWSMVKEGQMKQSSQDPDSLEDVESSLMDCDPQEKSEFSEEKLFKEQEQCCIPWASLVTRPPQHTLVVERMHSGARRYTVLDFGHTVRLTDVIIPSCSDLVTLCIDIWVTGEETDCVKLAFATDIATKHLVVTDIQPPPLCRYMKITTIGRYGMSAMKCKIPLGWFYGEITDIANVQASINALNALHQDLSCRFRLATGKLMDLLNGYLELYNGNAAHMMSYLNITAETDTKVVTAYQECIELQQQLHTCNNILKKLQNNGDNVKIVPTLIDNGELSSEALLETASTDKLRVISENIVDMLLYFYFQMGDVQYPCVSEQWCSTVLPRVWELGGRGAGALATLVARVCGAASWWGEHLADTLTNAFAQYDAPPTALDRCLVLVIYMCRKSLFAHGGAEAGVAPALASRALDLVRSARPQPAVTAALLTALAAVLDAVAAHSSRHARWDWVTGGRAGGNCSGNSNDTASPRSAECKLHRRKLHKKLLHQMQELEAARRGIQVALEDQQRARLSLKARMAMVGKRSSRGEAACGGASPSGVVLTRARPLSPALAARLAHALVAHMLAADTCAHADALMLAAKVVGRLCALSGGASLLDPSCILGLARLAVTLPPWPRHALTTLLQDLVEYESGESPSSPPNEETWCGASSSRVIRVHIATSPGAGKQPRKFKGPTVADLLADSFGLAKSINFSKPKLLTAGLNLANLDVEEQLTQVAESDDSESSEEKLEQYFIDAVKKETSRSKIVVDNSSSNVSVCADARAEAAGGGGGGAGEAHARRALLRTAGALAAAVKAPPPVAPQRPPAPAPTQPAAGGASLTSPTHQRHHPPLTHTLYDVFRHLALEFHYQMDCTFMENVISLWLTLNGSAWGAGGAWSLATLAVPADTPRIRLASDTVNALLHSLCTLENISLRCWVLSMQALAWIASLPLQTEGSSTQTMGRVILECEHFVPAIVKFITMNVNTDGAVSSSEPYLGGAQIGAGAGAASALHSVISRVVCARGANGALAALRAVCGVWRRDADAGQAYDLQATLLRLALPMLQVLSPRHVHHALPLMLTVAHQSVWWVRESSGWRGEGGSEARLSGLLADVLAGGGSGACRRAPLRRAVLAQLLHYCRKLLSAPLPHAASPATATSSATSSASASGTQQSASSSSSPPDQSQTDESKAQHSAAPEATNVEDERKQQAARTPCFADTVLQHQQIMQKFYRTLSICDGLSTAALNSSMNSDSSSLKEEVFWMVAHMATIASNPALMVTSLMEFLRREEVVNLSQAMQQLIIRLLDYPEALAAFIDAGGLELALEKLTACHQSGTSSGQGLVSSLMNYLKLPPQLINMSTPASANNKKNQPPVIETANGMVNIAPLCTVSCGNPTAQAADVLLDGAGGGVSVRGACAARRVRAAAWSYHFFSADDASLALTLTLPYAVQLHEVQLQPHLTSLATCPGAVAVEAGCGGTLAPLGPPQSTAGMTFIRLVVARPIVCTTVQIRLYKPRDSSNMGLLQLRLLAAPAFNNLANTQPNTSNNWACVVAACARSGGAAAARLARGGAGGVGALCALVATGGAPAAHAHAALLAAARHAPALRAPLVAALLAMDAHAHAHAFQTPITGRGNGSMWAVCELLRQLCRCCAEGSARAYVQWLAAAAPPLPPASVTPSDPNAPNAPNAPTASGSTPNPAQRYQAPSAALTHTLAEVLWMLKEKHILDNLEELITDELFELVYNWVKQVPESGLLKKSLDAILCSMCYIRPELFRKLLEHMDIPMDEDESMEGLTDDTKGQAPGGAAAALAVPWEARGGQLQTVAAAAMSPAATLALLHSRLPQAVVKAISDFSEVKLEMLKEQRGSSQEDIQMKDSEKESKLADLPSLKSVWHLVEWARGVCWSKRLKDWLGGPGSTFWKPLLTLLCHPRPNHSTWQEDAQYAQLEESTIRLFAELISCHPANQKLFASTLHSILESMECTGPRGISGFTRALILRLVLSAERIWLGVRWMGAGCALGAGGAAVGSAHPAHLSHAVMPLPLHTAVRQLLTDHRPPMPVMEEGPKLCMAASSASGGTSVLRSASDTAITTVAEAWELSLAAASASKDKRVKDVKNSTLKQQNNKKRQSKTNNDASVSVNDEVVQGAIRVQVAGLEGFISSTTTLAQLAAAVPHDIGPHLTFTLHFNANSESWGPLWEGGGPGAEGIIGSSAVLREFGACGGLALVAARLPRPHAPPPAPPAAHHHHHHDLDWVKLDDPYEEVLELGVNSVGGGSDDPAGCSGVPAHALIALGLLLKLPGYAHALLDEGARACHLLRLLLGVTHDEDGRSIAVGEGSRGGGSLGTLPFLVVARLLEKAPRHSPEGRALRRSLLQRGAVRLLLACLAVFTHHRPNSNDNSQASNGSTGKSEEKSQLYWAKGTGFGTGSTQQSWNVEQALVRQRTEEEHVTVLLQVLASYMNPGEKWPPEEGTAEMAERDPDEEENHDLPLEFIDLVANSSLVPAICSYLRNDSVLDMSRHIPLYVHVLRCARALHVVGSRRLTAALRPLPRLLSLMSRTTNSYATKLRMSKKNIFGKMTYSQRFSTSSNSELSEEDEGLPALIADIQATMALMCRAEAEAEAARAGGAALPLSGASREARYIELMRTMQFETFEMIAECAESGFRFLVPYHFESAVRAAGERAHPARMKRLAQEAATLATSLPLSYSSSVFVRTDADRLDVMKVLITGPSDTPYANGCFVLDVYFPAEYPAVPMLINLETTGRHSVRFNPNLYNDGKVCLSVLNTWHGRPEEKWNAHTSSFLQVLVSIQSLILVPEPYFNEPGYERSRGTRVGSSASLEYNSNIYQACVRWAMLDHLRNPEPCFKEVIQTHFWIKRNEIMQTVANWITELESQSGDERTQRSIQLNLMALKRHYVKLQEELAKLPVPAGLEELDEPFQLPAAPSPPPATPASHASPTPLTSPAAPAPPTNDEIDHDMEKIVSQVLD